MNYCRIVTLPPVKALEHRDEVNIFMTQGTEFVVVSVNSDMFSCHKIWKFWNNLQKSFSTANCCFQVRRPVKAVPLEPRPPSPPEAISVPSAKCKYPLSKYDKKC